MMKVADLMLKIKDGQIGILIVEDCDGDGAYIGAGSMSKSQEGLFVRGQFRIGYVSEEGRVTSTTGCNMMADPHDLVIAYKPGPLTGNKLRKMMDRYDSELEELCQRKTNQKLKDLDPLYPFSAWLI